jgi:hypothetical protein
MRVVIPPNSGEPLFLAAGALQVVQERALAKVGRISKAVIGVPDPGGLAGGFAPCLATPDVLL